MNKNKLLLITMSMVVSHISVVLTAVVIFTSVMYALTQKTGYITGGIALMALLLLKSHALGIRKQKGQPPIDAIPTEAVAVPKPFQIPHESDPFLVRDTLRSIASDERNRERSVFGVIPAFHGMNNLDVMYKSTYGL